MKQDSLQRAIKCLRISDIWQREASASLGEALEGKGKFPEQHEVLFKHVVLRSLWGKADSEGSTPYVFRVHIAFGVRFVEIADASETDAEQDLVKAPALAQIESTYVAEYLSEKDPGQNALKAFALSNASYHVWPFWREFLASQCARMNLPKVSLPLQSFAANREKTEAE